MTSDEGRDPEIPSPQPPTLGRWLRAVAAGLLAFVGTWAVGMVIAVLVIRAIPPAVPHPTEAYEGFGDYMMTIFLFKLGAALSFVAAVIVALVVADRVAYRKVASHPGVDEQSEEGKRDEG